MKTNNNVLNSIAALDFKSIKNKLMDVASGEGWSQAKADAMEIEYRRFLHLMHAFPNAEASPTKAVDTFWHYHILDTQKYAADCDQVFGCFMHHNPNPELGESTEEHGVDRMQELYEATFGEDYIRADAYGLDEAGEAFFANDAGGYGMAPTRNLSGAQSAVCWAACMMQTKSENGTAAVGMRQAQPAGAQAAVCWAACMMQTKSATAQGAAGMTRARPAGAKSAVCWAACMMQTKSATATTAAGMKQAKPAGAKSAVCWAACMMQTKSATATAAAGVKQAKPAGAKSAVCWAACMMQTKPATAKAPAAIKLAKRASAQAAVCWAACMMQTKPAGVAAAVRV